MKGVLQTMVRDVVQDGAGPERREWFFHGRLYNTFSCVDAKEKVRAAEGQS